MIKPLSAQKKDFLTFVAAAAALPVTLTSKLVPRWATENQLTSVFVPNSAPTYLPEHLGEGSAAVTLSEFIWGLPVSTMA